MESEEPTYEPTEEIRLEYERFLYLVENFRKAKDTRQFIEWKQEYTNLQSKINADIDKWKDCNRHLLLNEKNDAGLTFVYWTDLFPKKTAEECHYFKYGSIDYCKAASDCPDPASFSLERGKPGIIWNCYQALPDNLRVSERNMLYYMKDSPMRKVPTQDELRQWIKGKTPDNEVCNVFVCGYILSAAPMCYELGYNYQEY